MNIPRPVAYFQQKNPTGPYIMTFAPGLKDRHNENTAIMENMVTKVRI